VLLIPVKGIIHFLMAKDRLKAAVECFLGYTSIQRNPLPLCEQPLAAFSPAAEESKPREGWHRQAQSCLRVSGPALPCGEQTCISIGDRALQPAGEAPTPDRGRA